MLLSGQALGVLPISGQDSARRYDYSVPSAYRRLLNDPAGDRLYLIEAEPYDAVAASLARWNFSDKGYETKPTDSLANTTFEARASDTLSFQRQIYTPSKIGGRSLPGFGRLELKNADGEIDAALTQSWNGRAVRVKCGAKEFAYDDFGVIFSGTAAGLQWTTGIVSVNLRDFQFLLDKPIQQNLYAGTGGYEGTAELKGKPKPLCYGKCLNITPIFVNPATLVYQLHDGAIQAIDAVYDNGVALGGGQYSVDLANGRFTLNNAPTGLITCDVRGANAGGYNASAHRIVERILLEKAGFLSGDLFAASFIFLDLRADFVCGIYLDQPTNMLDTLDDLINSIGGWYTITRTGQFQVGVLNVPLSARARFTEQQIIDIERVETPIPTWRRRIGYKKNWTVQSQDRVAGAVSQTRRQFLAEEYRTVSVEDSGIKTRHLLGEDPPVLNTLLDSETDAQTIANRLFGFFSADRDIYRVTLGTQPFVLEPGDSIEIAYSRFGLVGGRRFVIVGLQESASANRIIADLWG